MQSLFSKGIKDPEDVVQRCLTHFRKCDLSSLAPYISPQLIKSKSEVANGTGQNSSTQPPPPLIIGNSTVYEQGPLASLQSILDIGARRVLPGHLLRRSRVLGTLRLTPRDFQQRIALTAQTGEESVLTWHLHWMNDDYVDKIKDATTDAIGGRWIIVKIERESEIQSGEGESQKRTKDEEDYSGSKLPSTPQPKSSPESVIYAQLEALQRGDVYEASQFNTWSSTTVSQSAVDEREGKEREIKVDRLSSFSLGVQYELLRDILLAVPYSVLANHSSAVLGAAALPTQRSMLQEVWVKSGRKSVGGTGEEIHGGEWVRFIWNLNLETSIGCWMCTKIEPYYVDTT